MNSPWDLKSPGNFPKIADTTIGGGAGSALNPSILISAGVATFVATAVSIISIVLQLKVRLIGSWSSQAERVNGCRIIVNQFCSGENKIDRLSAEMLFKHVFGC